MPMPNKHTTDGNYRYAFQGQEKDGETGMEAFELRQWDGRLGRWLTVDPYNEFYSPYVGMGNNPISLVDPDGGCTKCPKNAKVGDTFNHPEYGTLTYSENGWFDSNNMGIMNDVVLNKSESNFIYKLGKFEFTSSVDLELPEDYNINSKSYSTGGKYNYSLADLEMRQKLKQLDGSFWRVIKDREARGVALPISMHDGYREYTAKWGTDQAWIFALDPTESGGGYFYDFDGMPEPLPPVSASRLLEAAQSLQKVNRTRDVMPGLKKASDISVKKAKINTHTKHKGGTKKKGLKHRRSN
jgi:RHS repeat-associated protein